MTQALSPEILEKLQKIKNMEASPNEEEAHAATLLLQKLLQKHNIELWQLNAHKQKSQFAFVRTDIPIERYAPWKSILLHTLCDYNFCTSLKNISINKTTKRKTTTSLMVIGLPENVEVVVTLFQTLLPQFEHFCDKKFMLYKSRNVYTGHKKTWNVSFYMGALGGIQERLKEQQDTFMQQSNDCKALVLVNQDQLQAFIKEQFHLEKKSVFYRANVYDTALEAGKQASQDMQMFKEVQKGK